MSTDVNDGFFKPHPFVPLEQLQAVINFRLEKRYSNLSISTFIPFYFIWNLARIGTPKDDAEYNELFISKFTKQVDLDRHFNRVDFFS